MQCATQRPSDTCLAMSVQNCSAGGSCNRLCKRDGASLARCTHDTVVTHAATDRQERSAEYLSQHVSLHVSLRAKARSAMLQRFVPSRNTHVLHHSLLASCARWRSHLMYCTSCLGISLCLICLPWLELAHRHIADARFHHSRLF